MKILQIDSSVTGQVSVSRELTAAVVDALRTANPGSTVVHRDLAARAPAHLDGAILQSLRPQPGAVQPDDDAYKSEVAFTDTLVSEFLDADVVVVGAPMYNFSIPSQLKAWIDRVAQAGKTFRYTANGPEGLAGDKRVIIASSRGGMYAGTAQEHLLDHQEAYLRGVFGFFGITGVEIVRAEGVAMGPEPRARAMELALAQSAGFGQRRAA